MQYLVLILVSIIKGWLNDYICKCAQVFVSEVSHCAHILTTCRPEFIELEKIIFLPVKNINLKMTEV